MSHRNLKIDELIKKELARIILKELEFPQDCLLTIINVKTGADLKKADVFISVIPSQKENRILRLLKRKQKYFQYLLTKRLAMRSIPTINFQLKEKENTNKENQLEELFRQISNNKS